MLYQLSHCPPNCCLPRSSAASCCKHYISISAYRQIVWTQIRLLLVLPSDLGRHCLQQGQQMTHSRQCLVAISSRRVIRYCLYPIACCMFLLFRGLAGLKFRVPNSVNRFNALMQRIPKGEHMKTAKTQMSRRKMWRLIRVFAVCHDKHALGNGG